MYLLHAADAVCVLSGESREAATRRRDLLACICLFVCVPVSPLVVYICVSPFVGCSPSSATSTTKTKTSVITAYTLLVVVCYWLKYVVPGRRCDCAPALLMPWGSCSSTGLDVWSVRRCELPQDGTFMSVGLPRGSGAPHHSPRPRCHQETVWPCINRPEFASRTSRIRRRWRASAEGRPSHYQCRRRE